MNRYFISIMHDGIITIPRMMLDVEDLKEAKECAEFAMKEHNSSQSIIEDADLNKLVEFKHGRWSDEPKTKRLIESKIVVSKILVAEIKNLQRFTAKKNDHRFYLEHVIFSPSDGCLKATNGKVVIQTECNKNTLNTIGLFETNTDKTVYIINESMVLFRDGEQGFPVVSRIIPLDRELTLIDTVSTEGKERVNNLSGLLNKSLVAVSYAYLDILPRGVIYKAYQKTGGKQVMVLKSDTQLGNTTIVLMSLEKKGELNNE